MLAHPGSIVDRLIEFQKAVRDVVIRSHRRTDLADVAHVSSADTIYKIDSDIDPILIDFCNDWSKSTPLVLVAEGLTDEDGTEGPRVFPRGTKIEEAEIQLIVDPIDGTRGIMYDKRSAWSLAGVAPNRGAATRLREIEVSVMTELPTSKAGRADVLSAIRGQGVVCRRVDLRDSSIEHFNPHPSRATSIDHGFASVSNFFPGTKILASELMEFIVERLVGKADVTRATVFDDQYISTGGQFYELIVGHDRFICDLRPLFYKLTGANGGMCCHPYDCAGFLIAEETGVILTDGLGLPLDGPFDCTTDISWAGFANQSLFEQIHPIITEFFNRKSR